jgi:hypothetical protein
VVITDAPNIRLEHRRHHGLDHVRRLGLGL